MTSVTQLKPIDTTMVKDKGCKALVLLAHSLGWNVIVKSGAPVRLKALDGHVVEIITYTNPRSSAFQSWLSQIIGHSVERTPTIELIDHIVKATKPNKEQENRLRLALGESPQQHRERMANDKVAEFRRDEPHLTQKIEVPPIEPEPEPELPTVGQDDVPTEEEVIEVLAEVTERHIVKVVDAIVPQGPTRGYISPCGLERHFSDGSIDYKCRRCSYSSAKLTSVSAHWGSIHKDAPSKPREYVDLTPETRAPERQQGRYSLLRLAPEPQPQPPSYESELDAEAMITMIRSIVATAGDRLMQEENEALLAENQRLVKENEELRTNLQALKDLLRDI